METIRQKGKIILYSSDGTSIRMIFKNLTGRNFHCRDGEVIGKGEIPNV